jgi:hypothetical protein
MRLPKPIVTLALAAAVAVPLAAEVASAGKPKHHHGHGRLTRAYDSGVARAWADLLYATIRDEKLNPPLASRVIGYFGVTMYESVVPGMPHHRTLGGQLNDLARPIAAGLTSHKVSWPLAANAALAKAMHGLFPAGTAATHAAIDALEQAQSAALIAQHAVPATVVDRSVAQGRAVADAILAWAGTDGLAAVLAMPWAPPAGPGLWVPTPPANVANPLLPHWGKMRPFALDDALDGDAPPPPAYSADPSSAFFAAAKQVYDTVNALTSEQLAIAKFWADAGAGTGTPPGHWVRIVSQVAAAEDLGLDVVAEGYARLGIAVADAFICCWRTKFDWNLLRPVSYIRAHIDAGWLPPIATPPFPAYTSGHSTQSGATSYVLSDLLGEIPFTDDTHAAIGLPARSFSGFTEAAEEAAISRLYGGIHYSFDNDAGFDAGQDIGRQILDNVRFTRGWRRGHGCRCSCR